MMASKKRFVRDNEPVKFINVEEGRRLVQGQPSRKRKPGTRWPARRRGVPACKKQKYEQIGMIGDKKQARGEGGRRCLERCRIFQPSPLGCLMHVISFSGVKL